MLRSRTRVFVLAWAVAVLALLLVFDPVMAQTPDPSPTAAATTSPTPNGTPTAPATPSANAGTGTPAATVTATPSPSPTETTTVTATATASPPVSPSRVATAAPDLDAANPLRWRYAPAAGGPPGSLGRPNLDGVPAIFDFAELRARAPRIALLDDPESFGLRLSGVEGRAAADGRFIAAAYYTGDGGRSVTLSSWTRSGAFEYIAPTGPTQPETRQGSFGGLFALTTLPTVVSPGELAVRQVFLASEGLIVSITATGFESVGPVFQLAEAVAAGVQSQAAEEDAVAGVTATAPGPPATGNGPLPGSELGALAWLSLGIEATLVAGLLLVLRRRGA